MEVEVLAAWIGAIAAIIAAALSWIAQRDAAGQSAKAGRWAAAVGAKATVVANDKTVLVGSVTAERAKWRSEMREATASLVALLREDCPPSTQEKPGLYKLISEISLRLNPAGRSEQPEQQNAHKLDRDIYQVLKEILDASPNLGPERQNLADRLERSVALLLKQEWDVSKGEAVNGVLATPAPA